MVWLRSCLVGHTTLRNSVRAPLTNSNSCTLCSLCSNEAASQHHATIPSTRYSTDSAENTSCLDRATQQSNTTSHLANQAVLFTLLLSTTHSLLPRLLNGRPGGTRTPNSRFWRPVLYQLNYWPTITYYFPYLTAKPRHLKMPRLCASDSAQQYLFDDLGYNTSTNSTTTFTDRKTQTVFHRNR